MNIFDDTFNGAGRSEMYRAQITPDLFPAERPMRIENWSAEDREMFCGGIYTEGLFPGFPKVLHGVNG